VDEQKTFEELLARVAERAALIDPDLDLQLESAFMRAARERMAPPAVERLREAVEGLTTAGFAPAAIETGSKVPGGSALHQVVAKVVGRQIGGLAQQSREFGNEIIVALYAVLGAFDEVLAATRADVVAEIDALHERIFVLEHQVRDLQASPARGADEARAGADPT
jgi:hypothetical protein